MGNDVEVTVQFSWPTETLQQVAASAASLKAKGACYAEGV